MEYGREFRQLELVQHSYCRRQVSKLESASGSSPSLPLNIRRHREYGLRPSQYTHLLGLASGLPLVPTLQATALEAQTFQVRPLLEITARRKSKLDDTIREDALSEVLSRSTYGRQW
jgi:hypothetical protein